ncbi:MAG: hypothetical protein OEV78_06025 [Spirochaetia bacterium]|nr:hypothetical protein [Spirochaetia bacterium]
MKKFKTNIVIIGILMGLGISYCKDQTKAAGGSDSNKLLILNDLTYKEDPEINSIARLIGAKPLPEGSSLLPIANSAEYKKYYEDINSAWSTFESKHLNLVDKWIAEHPKKQCGHNLFYPFSGPDILHAIKFYPDAETIHMFALERFGGMPHPDTAHPEREAKKMFALLDAIKASLNYHYFITSYMSGQVGENEYSGVIGIMLFALARLEIQVLDVYPVIVNETGHLEKSAENKYAKADAVAIFYKKQQDKDARVVVYFKGDASDPGLAKNPNLQIYLKSLKGYSTLLKAASNLMYDKTFDDMRTQILAQSKCIISDDSGIPFHYLNNGNWNVKLYGVYAGPLVYFKNRFDPFLFKAIKEKAEPLPFDYGYRRGEGMSHIIFSERKPDYPYFEPTFDSSGDIGDTTSWNNGQFYFINKPAVKDIEGRLKYKNNEGDSN